MTTEITTTQEHYPLLNFLTEFKKRTGHNPMDNTELSISDYAAYTKELVNHYEGILSCMPNNVYWLDRNCTMLGGNDNLARIFGLKSHHDLVGLTYEQMSKLANWTEGQGEAFKQAELRVMETGIPSINQDEPPVMIDGEKHFFISNKVPLYNLKREIIGVLGISTDITQHKQIEEALTKAKNQAEAANKAKTEFLENMRHDIRTPLTGIAGFANIIKDEIQDPKIKEYVENLTASSQALLDLMNEILEAIKINSGEIPRLKKKFDLKKRLEDVIKLNQAKAQQKRIQLIFDYDPHIPCYVLGDSTRIHRLVLELIVNALNFTEVGSVKLTAKLAKNQRRDCVIKIIIEDTGLGIDKTKQEEIFLQFKRLTPSFEGIYKGTGLGLAIVKQFLDDLDGEIYVDSQIGSGSTFTCIIPLKKALLDESDGSDPEPILITPNLNSASMPPLVPEVIINVPTEQKKSAILLVEDNAIAATVVTAMLKQLNCRIDCAIDGKAALQLQQDHVYDLIFMDIGLPDMSGYDVTKKIRMLEIQKGVHIPIIALTAHVDEENKQYCIEAGMNAVLSKPLVREKAEDMLNAFIPYRNEQKNVVKNEILPEQSLFTLEGKTIDFPLSKKQLGGNEEMAHQMLEMLADSLPDELTQLTEAYQHENWLSIQAIAHKLRGGASYCGAVRLKGACCHLEDYLRANSTSFRTALFQQLITEIQAVAALIKAKSYSLT